MKKLLVVIATLLLTAASAFAQDLRRLSLEIKYNATLPPVYISVRGPEEKPTWTWMTRFALIPGVKPADPLPIQAVRVEPQFNGETADIKVTLLRGREGFEREDKVGTYQLGLNEQLTVDELRAFGVEPIILTLTETVPPLPPNPEFENRTRSIEIVNVISTNMPLPTYKLALRNLSEKNVRAIKVDVISDGRVASTTFLQAPFDSALIEPGAVLERKLQVVRAQKTAAAYTPGAAVANTIRIRAVVFDDLTFEGEEEEACRYETFIAGRRLWLRRVLPLLDQELKNPNLTASEFKQNFSSLTYELAEHEKTPKSSVSATCANPDSFVNIGTEGLKLELFRDLDTIITTRPAPPINFRAWLEKRRDDYRGWLARVE